MRVFEEIRLRQHARQQSHEQALRPIGPLLGAASVDVGDYYYPANARQLFDEHR